MSLFCYDFSKWTIVTILVILTVCLAGMVNLAYGQIVANQSSLYLEANIIPMPTTTEGLEITKFDIQQGNSTTSFQEICPSLQCKVDFTKATTTFSPPDIPKYNIINLQIEFIRIQDDITHANMGEKKKELVEQYNLITYCEINDIVEDNGQEIYYCDSTHRDRVFYLTGYISNKFDSRTWELNVNGIYDAKNQTLKIGGNFTG